MITTPIKYCDFKRLHMIDETLTTPSAIDLSLRWSLRTQYQSHNSLKIFLWGGGAKKTKQKTGKHEKFKQQPRGVHSTSPKIILYMGYPCCHSWQLTGREKIRGLGVERGESSRCDNCDKSRQSVALKNTTRISPSLLFFQDDSLMSTTCNIYSHRVSDCLAVLGSTKNATY